MKAKRGRQQLEGLVTLITGGGSGIGHALGAAMARHGAHVVLADINEAAAQQGADRLEASGLAASWIALDVTDREAFEQAFAELVGRHGGIDFLVNCAGITLGGPTHELRGPHWDAVLDVNLGGVINGILAAYPHMVERGHGSIVNVASAAGLAAPPFVVPYAASKHAVVGLSLGLRPEAAIHGVRVSVVCPGSVDTPILDQLPSTTLPATATAPVTARSYLSALGQTPISADRFATAALRQMVADKAVIVFPRRERSLWILHRISPTLTQAIARALARKIQRDLLDNSTQPR